MRVVADGVGRTVAGKMHLAEVSFVLDPGVPHVLLGRTGAGKTSLLRLLAGLDAPTAGAIRREGGTSVAFVYQQFVNYPSLTVYENIAAPLRAARVADVDARVREAARLLRIEPQLSRLPAEISGGQQQRTAIARALVKDADLLLLDEPLANLDFKLREELRDELREIFAKRASAVVVYATAEPREALLMGGRAIVMHEGRVLQEGVAREVWRRPATVDAARVFSDPEMNLLDAEVAGGEAMLSAGVRFPLSGHLSALAPGKYRFGVHAGHVALDPPNARAVKIPAKVELEEVSGSETILHATAGQATLVVQEPGVRRHARGSMLDLFLDPARILAFGAGGTLEAAP